MRASANDMERILRHKLLPPVSRLEVAGRASPAHKCTAWREQHKFFKMSLLIPTRSMKRMNLDRVYLDGINTTIAMFQMTQHGEFSAGKTGDELTGPATSMD
jgi:hypothetical protein